MSTRRLEIEGKRLALGRYEVRQFVSASGRFAEIWEAWDLWEDRAVILKLLKVTNLHDEALTALFFEEINILRKLDGIRGAVALLDQGHLIADRASVPGLATEFENIPFLVLERARGASLLELIAPPRKLDERTAVLIAIAICEVMEAAHRAGVVHNDFRHEHVHVDTSSDPPAVTVIDWNLSRDLSIRRNQQKFGVAVDIEGFAELLYNMFTGFKIPLHDAARAGELRGRKLAPIQSGVPTIVLAEADDEVDGAATGEAREEAEPQQVRKEDSLLFTLRTLTELGDAAVQKDGAPAEAAKPVHAETPGTGGLRDPR